MRSLANLLICSLASSVVMGAGTTAFAQDSVCMGGISGTHDNIVVPPGAACQVVNGDVRGNITALEDSILVVLSSTVGGNIEGEGAETVQLGSNTVGGSIQISDGEVPNNDGAFDVFLCGNTLPVGNIHVKEMSGSIMVGDPPPGEAFTTTLCRSNLVVKGSVKVEKNVAIDFPGFPGTGFRIRGNSIGQSVHVFKNDGSATKRVEGNTVGHFLKCKKNSLPFVGGPNSAAKAQGQCF